VPAAAAAAAGLGGTSGSEVDQAQWNVEGVDIGSQVAHKWWVNVTHVSQQGEWCCWATAGAAHSWVADAVMGVMFQSLAVTGRHLPWLVACRTCRGAGSFMMGGLSGACIPAVMYYDLIK
jgi:hypothetical protein